RRTGALLDESGLPSLFPFARAAPAAFGAGNAAVAASSEAATAAVPAATAPATAVIEQAVLYLHSANTGRSTNQLPIEELGKDEGKETNGTESYEVTSPRFPSPAEHIMEHETEEVDLDATLPYCFNDEGINEEESTVDQDTTFLFDFPEIRHLSPSQTPLATMNQELVEEDSEEETLSNDDSESESGFVNSDALADPESEDDDRNVANNGHADSDVIPLCYKCRKNECNVMFVPCHCEGYCDECATERAKIFNTCPFHQTVIIASIYQFDNPTTLSATN
ncbi:hypothetical protein PENTCL1PPCAC_26064, partial [Pristionchus entomophagus]